MFRVNIQMSVAAIVDFYAGIIRIYSCDTYMPDFI